ncbi:hypothetical protein AAGF08_01605 [Algoriphagus sp. SE2]|uniref:hypothetical protein n=1 Tax=Algoriphagus sp. SE2 TaxID=3141536 RepID=UPI0031CD5D14
MINHHTELESFLEKEFNWIAKLIEHRMNSYFNHGDLKSIIYEIPFPKLSERSSYEIFLSKHDFGIEGRLIISMILASILRPEIFDVFYIKNEITGLKFSCFGGKSKGNRFIPTYRTAVFILSGNKLPIYLSKLFQNDHAFSKFSILNLSGTSLSSNLDKAMKLNPDIENLLLGIE